MMLGLTVGVSAVGKVAGGALADSIGVRRLLRVALLSSAFALLLLQRVDSLPMLGLFVVVYGLSLGAQVAVIPALAREILGEQDFGSLFGVLQLGAMLAAAVGPVLAGLIHDATSSYVVIIWTWFGAMFAAFGVSFALPRSTLFKPTIVSART